MQRTTIMIEEDLLQELKRLASAKQESTSNLIREALAHYVATQHADNPPPNPLLALVGLGASPEPTDVANGRDAEWLQAGIDPIYGWSVRDDHTG
ncbi:MAG: ribbon-helix-helix domain-containing protein [Chloroflexi bacterium]|nr:ribbon-helix-helix domain-containing protein [Chloroflexota bacterium]